MILQSLHDYYQRLLDRGEQGLSAFGYSPEKVGYEIVLNSEGRIIAVNDIRNTIGKKPAPRILSVPQPAKRASGVKPNFLWDKTSYVMGVSSTSKRTAKEHAAFKALHLQNLADEEDVGIQAFLAFIRGWHTDDFRPPFFNDTMLDANFVFRLDGERMYLHERSAAQNAWARIRTNDESQDAAVYTCLVTGLQLPAARLHPAIKGVNGAQSSGASIVSFNLDAFTSYGKVQGDNAPVSEAATFAYTTALNHLLRRDATNRQRLQIGDATVVFWARAKDDVSAQQAEATFANMLDPPADDEQEAGRLRRVLEGVSEGRALHEMDPGLDDDSRIFVLGLSPNAARLSIRFWVTDSLSSFLDRFAQHAKDISLAPQPWRTAPAVWQLARTTAPVRDGRSKAEDVVPNLAAELSRAILCGNRYPQSLLANVLMRMRSDGDLSGLRVAVCKAVLARNRRLGIENQSTEEVPVSLDVNSTNPGYRLGRLFAVLEDIQHAALGKGVNATIRDKYYGAASATPASIFPVLLRNVQNHLARLRKNKPGLAINFEKSMVEIMGGLSENLPRSLRIEDQGRFALGYYHQMKARFIESADAADIQEPSLPQANEGVHT